MKKINKPLTYEEIRSFAEFVGDSYTHAHLGITKNKVSKALHLARELNDLLKEAQDRIEKYDKQTTNT